MSSFRSFSNSSRRFFGGWSRSLRGVGRSIQRGFFSLWNWGSSRNWVYFAQGLPALAVSLAVIAVVAFRLSISGQELEARYLEKAETSFKAQNYPLATVCYERLVSMGDQERPNSLFEMAVAQLEQSPKSPSDYAKTLKIMNQLAPDNQKGFALAHRWQALYYGSTQQRKNYENHLLKALEANVPNPGEVQGLLGLYYLVMSDEKVEKEQSKDLERAKSKLEQAIKTAPQFRLRYAEALSKLGQKTAAFGEAKLALNYFKDRAQKDPSDKAARMAWADSLSFLEDFEEALEVLRDGLATKEVPEYRKAIVKTYRAWFLYVQKNEPNNFERQWFLLQTGLQHDSTDQFLLFQLSKFVAADPNDNKIDGAKIEDLRKMLAERGNEATAHFLLGLQHFQKGEKDQARVHWEQAHHINPLLPTVANNLAFLLAHDIRNDPKNPKFDPKSTDLERAEKIIQLVIDGGGAKEPIFRETRGEVYMKRKKWREALFEFEFILGAAPNYPNVHRNLADIYQQLGDSAMSAEHRKRQEDTERKAKSKTK
jgi:predicted Zn-dependent protease